MNISHKQNGNESVLTLDGRFDFNAHRDFRASYEPVLQNPVVKTLNLNMGRVDYLDSSALGMLLLLQEKAKAIGMEILISACPDNIRKILDVANFGKLFRVLP